MDRKQFLVAMSAFPFLPRLLSGMTLLDQTQRSMIPIWMDGGMSHLDTFDGKPEASPDITGVLESRESSLEGVFLSQHLPLLSGKIQRWYGFDPLLARKVTMTGVLLYVDGPAAQSCIDIPIGGIRSWPSVS
ncbi:MAG: DUF1501 domain-containing protein [Candidatus Poribacteria bacterium]|nr:DUF1501 domain-containing protein [Candidatus Poribacteria bacterium]